jgi:hypothetical protein
MTHRFTLIALSFVCAVLAQGCPPPDEPQICGGIAGASCDAGEFCNFGPDAQCGAADQTGLCEATPDACIEIFAPVCGCDDRTYDNECFAHAAGVSVAKQGSCEPAGVSCDPRTVLCDALPPECPDFQVAQVVGGCWGGCVPVDACVCDEAADCPNNDAYTCHMYRGRCGPYVN